MSSYTSSSLYECIFTLSFMNTFTERLKTAMAARKISQSELARRLGVTRGAVHLWCNSTTKELSAPNALKIAKVLQINPYWLVFGEGSMEPLLEAKLESKALQLVDAINRLDDSDQELAIRLLNQIKPAS